MPLPVNHIFLSLSLKRAGWHHSVCTLLHSCPAITLHHFPSRAPQTGLADGICFSSRFPSPPGLSLWQGCRWYRSAVTFYIVLPNCNSWWWDSSPYNCFFPPFFFFSPAVAFFSFHFEVVWAGCCTVHANWIIRPCTHVRRYAIRWFSVLSNSICSRTLEKMSSVGQRAKVYLSVWSIALVACPQLLNWKTLDLCGRCSSNYTVVLRLSGCSKKGASHLGKWRRRVWVGKGG